MHLALNVVRIWLPSCTHPTGILADRLPCVFDLLEAYVSCLLVSHWSHAHFPDHTSVSLVAHPTLIRVLIPCGFVSIAHVLCASNVVIMLVNRLSVPTLMHVSTLLP